MGPPNKALQRPWHSAFLVYEKREIRFGVDPTREAEVMHICRLPNGRHSYSGWFHLVGEIVEGGECWREGGSRTRVPDLETVTESFSMGFSSDRSIADAAFDTLPVVQLEFHAETPWVSSASEPE